MLDQRPVITRAPCSPLSPGAGRRRPGVGSEGGGRSCRLEMFLAGLGSEIEFILNEYNAISLPASISFQFHRRKLE